MTVKRAPSLLGLDTSLTGTGWARSYGDGRAQSGTWHLADNIDGRAGAFCTLYRRLNELHADDPLDAIAYEQPLKLPVDSVNKLIALLGLVAHVESWAKSRRVRVRGVLQSDWRKTFLPDVKHGAGREGWKRAAIERARQLDFNPLTDDEAEAVGVLDHLAHLEGHLPQWRADHPFLECV